jgi:hypothetical protein
MVIRENNNNSININNIISPDMSKRKVISLTNFSLHEENDEMNKMKNEERKTASPMCVPIQLDNNHSVMALVDQGCSRTLIRESALKRMKHMYHIYKVKNTYVIGSTGEYVPVVGSILVSIYSHHKFIVKTPIYIVRDTQKKNIICDFVLGRSSISKSHFPYVDTRFDGSLYNDNDRTRIACRPCKFIHDENNILQLRCLPSICSDIKIADNDDEDTILELNTSYIPDIVKKEVELKEKKILKDDVDVHDELDNIDFPSKK